MVILASFWKATRRPGEEGGSVLKVCVFTVVEIFNHRKRLCVNIQLALEQWGFMAVKNPRVNFRLPQNLTIKSLLLTGGLADDTSNRVTQILYVMCIIC